MSLNGNGERVDAVAPAHSGARVTPQPTPVTFDVRRHGDVICLALSTVTGKTIVFLDPSGARTVADSLTRAAGGLTIAREVPDS